MSPGWGRGSNRRCPFAGPSWRGHHSRRCSCLGVSPISVSPSFSPPSQTWLEFLVQNGFVIIRGKKQKLSPALKSRCMLLLPLGQTSSEVQFLVLRKTQKEKTNEARTRKCSSIFLSQRQNDEYCLKGWEKKWKSLFPICFCPLKEEKLKGSQKEKDASIS